MSLLLATRLECHLNSLTVNANQMRWLLIGPSWGRPRCFSWAVSINGATEHYTEGFGSPPALTGSHSHSVVVLFSIHACVLPVLLSTGPPTPPIFAVPAYACTWCQPLTHFITYASPLIYKHLRNSFIIMFEMNIPNIFLLAEHQRNSSPFCAQAALSLIIFIRILGLKKIHSSAHVSCDDEHCSFTQFLDQ